MSDPPVNNFEKAFADSDTREFSAFEQELTELISRYRKKNSPTPDYILAKFMASCLAAFVAGIDERERWYIQRGPK